MRIQILFLWLLVTSIGCSEEGEISNTWKTLPEIPEGFTHPSGGFAIDGKIFAGFNMTPDTSAWWSFDTKVDKWQRVKDFPNSKLTPKISVATGSKGYLGLGYDVIEKDGVIKWEKNYDLWEYDPDTDDWKVITQYPGVIVSEMTSFVIGSKIFISSKYEAETPRCVLLAKTIWEYDIANNSWTKKNDLFENLSGFCDPEATAISGEAEGYLMILEMSGTSCGLWRYDQVNDAWAYHSKCTFHNERLIFIIGRDMYFGHNSGPFWMRRNLDTLEEEWLTNSPGDVPLQSIVVTTQSKGYVFRPTGELYEYTP